MGTFQQTMGKQQTQQQIAPGIADVHLWLEECAFVEPQLGASKFLVNTDWRPDIARLSQLNGRLFNETQSINQQLQLVADQLDKQIQLLQ